ncbi:TPA: YbhB/YbcL family Raf kinase inhibitor-like protein [Haemophilus influenzae]|uniref:YbhB/YbcL family Raf kinase inhibitor-like protein n=1 Tax=Haemophilus influenzae TaxID=727 RepID=UPI001F07D25D|nr:YbhB/YbcL family Raf kinase inhibitor-like protein [Haemophilus influenzae]
MKKMISSVFCSLIAGTSYGFGCNGGNLSPAISWANAPKGTKSFVVTIYDKDAPTDIGWMHWVVANIPANTTTLPEGIKADGTNLPQDALQTRTDFGVPGFGGACPPEGQKHRYEIKVTAVSVETLPNVAADTPAWIIFSPFIQRKIFLPRLTQITAGCVK